MQVTISYNHPEVKILHSDGGHSTLFLPLSTLDKSIHKESFRVTQLLDQDSYSTITRNDCGTLGFFALPLEENISTTTKTAYQKIFHYIGQEKLLRVWHFVPQINEFENALENYQAFCSGRAEAFEEANEQEFPAASATGIVGHKLIIIFQSASTVESLENPNQVPAYEYPEIYGPKSPSFARASTTKDYFFISGTAAVIGHQSAHEDDLEAQLETTWTNLLLIHDQLSSRKETPSLADFIGKVYLRHANDYPVAREFLMRKTEGKIDNWIFLQSDICRKELLVEIEAHHTPESYLQLASLSSEEKYSCP